MIKTTVYFIIVGIGERLVFVVVLVVVLLLLLPTCLLTIPNCVPHNSINELGRV